MGQTIEVRTEVVDEVAMLIGDRSITGQDGEGFDADDAIAEPTTLPAAFAAHLFASDRAIRQVFVGSNVASVRRAGGWDDATLDRATEVLRDFFRYYPDDIGNGVALGGVGRSFDATGVEPLVDDATAQRLRDEQYTATISRIHRTHENLWIVGVRPDHGAMPDFRPGQYCTLGVGYWEPRVDGRREVLDPDRTDKRILRSYSMSSFMVDDAGELLDLDEPTEMEFYVVLVERERGDTPALLTPRLFAMEEGDPIFLGGKAAGRYTLDKVDDPTDNIVFISTGTGEAPHNFMTQQLLRDGHQGRILATCTVRYARDLAYLEQHRAVERRFPNYTYLPLTTRETENLDNKVYVQDLITNGDLEEALGAKLDPKTCHVFLCGNPAMIGLPEWDGDTPTWPEPTGVAELLTDRGFTLDRRGVEGNIHYEEYW